MIYLDLPTINGAGTVEQQLSEIRSYIFRSNEQLNASLSNLTVDKIWAQTASALSVANEDSEEKTDILTKYQKIRDLIIKSADIIIQADEQWQMAMNGSYLAKSQFGEYLLNTSVEIDGESTGFTQLYTYSSELGSDYGNYKSYQQNFIKEGLLDNAEATPIYGIDVGLLTSEFTVTKEDGTTETITVDSNKKMRITPTKLSLFDNDIEVAYISEGEIHFPKANITGGSININDNFKVDSEGNLIAKKGKFSGEIDASSITASLNKWSSHIKFSGGYIATYSSEKGNITSKIGENGQTFYNDAGRAMGKFSTTTYNGNRGIGSVLEYGTGAFIAIAGHYDSINASAYLLDVAWTVGNTDKFNNNVYPERGLHVNTPCYYHWSEVRDMDIRSLASNGCATKTGKIKVYCQANDGSEFWADMIVRNGLITTLYTETI